MKKQLNLNFHLGTHGGRRPNCGRKRIHSNSCSHKTRETIKYNYPLHINFKYKTQIRYQQFIEIFKKAISNSQKHGMRLIHYSIQFNHIHLIVESKDYIELTKSMRSLTATIVKLIQLQKKIKGNLQIGRYHLHILKTCREAENAFRYVILNELHHTGKMNFIKYSSISKNSKIVLDSPKCWLSKRATSSLADIASGA